MYVLRIVLGPYLFLKKVFIKTDLFKDYSNLSLTEHCLIYITTGSDSAKSASALSETSLMWHKPRRRQRKVGISAVSDRTKADFHYLCKCDLADTVFSYCQLCPVSDSSDAASALSPRALIYVIFRISS